MRPGYQVKTHFPGTRKRSSSQDREGMPEHVWNRNDGTMTFAYKGLVIEKRNALYRVRDVKLSGFPVQSVAGVFNDSRLLRALIDSGIAQSCPERLERLREGNRNVHCGNCLTPFLFRREGMIEHLGGFLVTCPYCAHEEFEDRLRWATDENFY